MRVRVKVSVRVGVRVRVRYLTLCVTPTSPYAHRGVQAIAACASSQKTAVSPWAMAATIASSEFTSAPASCVN